MKPVNSNLGATGSFVSRVSSISSSQASIDSVVFQQGKSILDFDLNVTQDVLKNSIESLARSILSKSGFLKSIAITSSYSSPNVTISIPPVDVALLGKIVRLSSSSATGNINFTANVSSGAFFWIELWYQEIIPEGTIETGKISVIKSYGYADDDSSLSNTMKDVTFGAETTRRVQLRWRVRSAQTTSSNFTDATITARGGSQAGVAGYNFYLSNSYASSTETALGASSVKNSLLEYALLNDSGVYIAGRGTDADAQALNTVDGRVYAFSLCTVAANSSSLTNTYSLVGATTSGALSGSSATIGNLNISSEVSATTLSIVNTAANSSNIVLSPANAGFVSGPNFQLSGDGTVLVPALRFSSSTSTGLYYTSASTVPELNISTAGVQRLKINASALTVSGNIIASTTNAYIQIGAGSITGLSTGESMITSLNALAFRSANVSITGGSITGSLTNSATQITGTIAAVAKTNFSFVNESVFSNTIANYTPPGVTSISASHVVTPYPRNGIVFVPGTNTTLLASYDDNYVYLQITTGTSSFETASGDSITPSNYVGKPSDSWSEGVSTRPARRDHIHKREGYATTTIGVPTSLYTTLNDSNLLGTSTAVARADHTHTLGSYIPAIGIGSARTSALTSVLEVTGLISDSAAHLTIRDSATNAANIGGKLSFAGVDYATSTTFLSYGSIGIYREAIGTNSTYASFVTRSAANLNESLRLYKNASARISTTAADYATTPADGSIEVENGAIAKYFKASSFVISNGVSTSASRFIGSVGAKPTAITNVTVGDFVIDTTGNIHVYSGSTSGWLTAGILTTAANSWTGSQQFGANRTWADTSGLTNTASAINMSSYNITLSAAQGSDSVRTMYVGGNVVTSAASSTTSVAANKLYAITATGGASNWASAVPAGTVVAVYPTTTANTVDYFTAPAVGFTLNQSSSTVTELLPLLTASTQDINGPPSFAGYSYIINSYGLRILTKAVAANTYPISGTSAYGLQVGIPTKASVVYGIHIPTVIATNSTYAYGLHVTAPSGATNNYGIYVSSGSVVLADATASTSSATGALQVAGGIYAGQASVFAGTVSLSNATASTSSTSGALQVAGGIYAGKASMFADVVSLSSVTASTSSTSGALQVAGGIYAGKASMFADVVSLSNATASTSSATGALQVAGGIYAGQASVFAGTVSLSNATASTSSTSGALQVAGGIYAGKASMFADVVSLSNVTASTSSATGALQVAGGIYAGQASVFAGTVSLSNATASTSSTSGALQVAGGIYAGKASMFADVVSLSNVTASTSSTSGALQVAGGIYAGKASMFADVVSLSNATASTSSATGALQVAGGIYAGQASVFAGTVSLSNATASTSSTSGALQVAGGIYAGQASVFAGTVSLSNATASTSSATGALQVAGGIYAGQASVFAGTVVIGSGEGTASVAGNTLRAPSAVGNNVAGASLTIAGGVSTGTATGGSIIFQTAPAGANGSNANGVAERMRILSNGSVGIGTSTPAEKLHINGNVLLENNNGYYIKRADGTALKFGSVDTNSQMGIGDGNVNAIYFTSGSRFFYNLNGNYIANIGPNGLRIGDSTAPAAPLDALIYSTQIANVLRLNAQAKDYTFANGTFSAVNTGAKTIVLTIDSAETTTAAQITASCIGSAIYGTGAGFGSFTAFSALFTVTSATTISSKLVITCTWTGSPATTPSNGAVTAIIINGYRAGWGPQLLFAGMADGRDTGAIRVLTETDGGGANAYMAFCTRGLETVSERMRLTSTGRLGIGTTDPSATLHVVGTVAGAVAPKVFLPAQAFNLPTSSFPAFYQRDTGTTKYELQYSGSADQFAHTTIVVPSSYSGGSITIKFYWYTALANQSVTWQILAASTGDGGDPNPSTSSLGDIVSTTNSAAKLKLQTYSWISSNTVSLPSAGQILYLSLKRVGSSNDQTFNFHSMIVEF